MTAIDPVDISNMALDLLRQKAEISSIDVPDSEIEALASRWYDLKREALLRTHPFNFARKRAVLSRNVVENVFGYSDAYNVPSDFIRLLFIGENYNESYEINYSIEGNQIVINNSGSESLNIAYIANVTDVAKFDPLFKELLIVEMAIVFANAITGINKGLKDIYAIKKDLEIQARAVNGQDNPPKTRFRSKFIGARRVVSKSNYSDGVHLFYGR
jgi:hypothetical protein